MERRPAAGGAPKEDAITGTSVMQTPHAPPPQSENSQWGFIEELKAPFRRPRRRRSTPGAGELDLSAGVQVVVAMADPEGLLDTARADLHDCLNAWNVPLDRGPALQLATTDLPEEAFRLEVSPAGARIQGGGIEGVRRGIFHLESIFDRAGGPFLPFGTVEMRPFIRRRISRCFFGPIKRPPKMRDELLDDADYYPENYLNRLAHEGVNGLWLTIEFRDLCRTSLTPEYGAGADRRFAKLRRTVQRCRRYGIRTYLFCIEPRAWSAEDAPILERHPELARGPEFGGGRRHFCPFSHTARQYLYEAVHGIFSAVPGLGGLINISHGERPTTCLSAMSAIGEGVVRCPVCAGKEPWEILWAALAPMEQGMHTAAPRADLISWLYMPQAHGALGDDLAPWVYEIPRHTPPGVLLQFNFESGVRRDFFGKTLVGGDYWLSVPGPSDRFERVAAAARAAGTPVSAKIQTGCSHEVATVPFVPVPGLLFRKFAGMRRLGVESTMLCWYFGNYPGIMNRAAGTLSFEPFPEDETDFLIDLARLEWGGDAAAVASAWERFAAAYENFPLTNLFQYYGPMHDGPAWPLHLKPVDAPLAPTWLLASPVDRRPWPPSGDRIGEAIGEAFTLDETVELCERMTTGWTEGVAILRAIEPRWSHDRDRLLDIGVAETLGIQFRSGWNILRFYRTRERMFRAIGPERLDLLDRLRGIAQEELTGDKRLLELCRRDSRLGFHPEAEGYKYTPERIRRRMTQLQALLERDAPEIEMNIRRGRPLFPEYTGARPAGPVVHCRLVEEIARFWADPARPAPVSVCRHPCGPSERGGMRWGLCRDKENLYLVFRCAENDLDKALAAAPRGAFPVSRWGGFSAVLFKIEPRRLWPCLRFAVSAAGGVSHAPGQVPPEARIAHRGTQWQGAMRFPLDKFRDARGRLQPFRFDVQRAAPGVGIHTWMPQHPLPPRLMLGSDNPADLGWAVFAESTP